MSSAPGFVGVRVESRPDQRHHLGLVADDIGHVAVIRMQGDADAQALGLVGTGQGVSAGRAEQADQCQAQTERRDGISA